MSWSRRRTLGLFAVAGPALASGCGFRPLYGKRGGSSASRDGLAQTKVHTVRARNAINDRLGQILHNNLLDRINPAGRPRDPRYALAVNMSVARVGSGIQITEEATRARLTVNATFIVTVFATGKTLLRGTERSVNSYNILDSEFATLSAERDAAGRAVREIADSIKARLALYFDNRQRQAK